MQIKTPIPLHFTTALYFNSALHYFTHIYHTLRSWLQGLSTIFRAVFPGLENNDTLKCSSNNLSRNNAYVSIHGKLSEKYLNVLLFSNPGDKVIILVKTMGQLCHLFFFQIIFRTLSHWLENNNTLRFISKKIQGMLTYVLFL